MRTILAFILGFIAFCGACFIALALMLHYLGGRLPEPEPGPGPNPPEPTANLVREVDRCLDDDGVSREHRDTLAGVCEAVSVFVDQGYIHKTDQLEKGLDNTLAVLQWPDLDGGKFEDLMVAEWKSRTLNLYRPIKTEEKKDVVKFFDQIAKGARK